MADKKCKTCRRAGEKLFLKGDKCFTPKCAMVERPYAPGKLDSEKKHKSSISEYGRQMKEKQKIRNIYGVSEKQFSNYMKDSMKNTREKVVAPSLRFYRNLECRLDNFIFRTGLVRSRALSRQVVTHGHILVNGKKLNIPSYQVKINDVMEIRKGSQVTKLFDNIISRIKEVNIPSWIEYDKAKILAKVIGQPNDIEAGLDITKVIEFYSK